MAKSMGLNMAAGLQGMLKEWHVGKDGVPEMPNQLLAAAQVTLLLPALSLFLLSVSM